VSTALCRTIATHVTTSIYLHVRVSAAPAAASASVAASISTNTRTPSARGSSSAPTWGRGNWGQGPRKWAGHGKNFDGRIFKYAVFNIKPTRNH